MRPSCAAAVSLAEKLSRINSSSFTGLNAWVIGLCSRWPHLSSARDPPHGHISAQAPAGSARETDFLDAALALADIPGVEQLRQTSAKNDFTFGFSMEFADQAAYDAYNEHPAHTAFVADRWAVELEDFLEIDYEPLG